MKPAPQLVVAAVVAIAASGCEVVYLPGDRAAADHDATSEQSLRRLVTAIPTDCDPATGARGTLRNRASRAVRVELVVAWRSEGGAPLRTRAAVRAPSEATTRWSSDPAPGASGGCSVGITGIATVPR